MPYILLTAVALVFMFGLVQWARSGAILWDIRGLMRPAVKSEEGDDDIGFDQARARRFFLREQDSKQKTLRSMERTMDDLLKSSLRVLGLLALFVWIFVMVTVVVDLLGLNWLDRLRFTVLGNPTVRANVQTRGASSGRGNTLRSLGSSMRR